MIRDSIMMKICVPDSLSPYIRHVPGHAHAQLIIGRPSTPRGGLRCSLRRSLTLLHYDSQAGGGTLFLDLSRYRADHLNCGSWKRALAMPWTLAIRCACPIVLHSSP